MIINGRAIIKRGRQLFEGTITDNVFESEREIKGFSGVSNPKDYTTLLEWLVINGEKGTKTNEKAHLKEIGASACFMYDPQPDLNASGGVNQKDWNNYFFTSKHKMCRGCKRECKQSSRTTLVKCASYDPIDS